MYSLMLNMEKLHRLEYQKQFYWCHELTEVRTLLYFDQPYLSYGILIWGSIFPKLIYASRISINLLKMGNTNGL